MGEVTIIPYAPRPRVSLSCHGPTRVSWPRGVFHTDMRRGGVECYSCCLTEFVKKVVSMYSTEKLIHKSCILHTKMNRGECGSVEAARRYEKERKVKKEGGRQE